MRFLFIPFFFRLYFWPYAVFALYTELMTPATVIINLSINGQTLFYKIQISEMQKSSEKSSDLNSSCAQLKHFHPFPRTRHIRLNFNYRYLLSYNIKSFVLYCKPSYDTRNRPVTSSRWWIFVFAVFAVSENPLMKINTRKLSYLNLIWICGLQLCLIAQIIPDKDVWLMINYL